MPYAALSRSRAFQLLLVVLLQVGLAPAVQGSCAVSDEVSMPCCADTTSAAAAAQTEGCHDNGLPEIPDPADEDPGCSCTIQPTPAPEPLPLGASKIDHSPAVGAPQSQAGSAPQLSQTWVDEHPTWPRARLGPPIYRLHCVFLI